MEAAEGDMFIVRVIRKLGDMNLSGGLSSFYIVLFILQVLMQLIIPFLCIMMYQLLDCYEEKERGKKQSKWTRKHGPPVPSETKSSTITIPAESFSELHPRFPDWHQTKSINKLVNKILYSSAFSKSQGKSTLQ